MRQRLEGVFGVFFGLTKNDLLFKNVHAIIYTKHIFFCSEAERGDSAF